MIESSSLIVVGRIVKPHGIKGEVSVETFYDLDLCELSCIVLNVDGINVPFFPEYVRPKGVDVVIMKVEDIDNEVEAKGICGHDLFALKQDVEIDSEVNEAGGYMGDFIGFTLTDADGNPLGQIVDFDDSTANILFVVETADGKRLYVPASPELVENIDPEHKVISLHIADGLVEL